ncbi:MAG: UDP-N-acetylmuramate--L-alanine ligase [Erysipelotrichaceae bacterium]
MYHFIGIKGSGMASLAEIMADKGEVVTGSDIEKYIFTQQPLEDRGIKITSFDASNIKENSIVIIGNAFDEQNVEVKQALSMKSVTCYHYHDFLGNLLKDYVSISVAGTHGKTTTTGILSHVMGEVAPTGYLIGDGTGFMPTDSKYFVLESCEYKRHFMAYHPDYAIITNIDLDHVDYYHDLADYISAFQGFANQVKKGCALFGDDDNVRKMSVKSKHLYYGLKAGNDVQARNIVEAQNETSYDIYYHNEFFGHFELPFVGKPFLWNTIGVIAVAIMEGIPSATLQHALATFPGVKRRFNIETKGDQVYIDDYAHHPTAIKLTIDAAKTKYPDKKIIAIFKPDRFSRVFYLMDQFAHAFDEADEIYLCHFPDNAAKEEGIDISILDLAKLVENSKVIKEDEESAKLLASRGPAVYLFMSSKDIYKFKNIVKSFH